MSLILIAALPFLGALLPGLMIRAGRDAFAGTTASVTLTALVGILVHAPAVMRGEVDATLKPIGSLAKYVASGDMRMIFTLTENTVLEGVQNATEIGHPEIAKFTINRVVGAPPGTPADVVAKLSAALETASKSAPVQEWASGSGTQLTFMPAAETSAMMSDLSSFYAQYKDLLSK